MAKSLRSMALCAWSNTVLIAGILGSSSTAYQPAFLVSNQWRTRSPCASPTSASMRLAKWRRHLSLSRLNHRQPGVQAHPEIVQGTAELHREIAHARLPQADPVFHNPTTLDAAVDMLDPESPLVERLVGQVLLQGQLPTAGLLRRHEDLHLRERERQEAQ